jgi:transposase InsO family protein
VVADDEARLRARMVELAEQHGRRGYRRITALLRDEGWHVNHKRVEPIWPEEGLKVPQKQPKPTTARGFTAKNVRRCLSN